MCVFALVGVLSPLARAPYDDSFPFSTFPMFASKRATKLTMGYALGVRADGTDRTLSPRMIGTGEVLQARAMIDGAMRSRTRLDALCTQIAARVADDDDFADVTQIRLVMGTHDAVEYLVHAKQGSVLERARCPVNR